MAASLVLCSCSDKASKDSPAKGAEPTLSKQKLEQLGPDFAEELGKSSPSIAKPEPQTFGSAQVVGEQCAIEGKYFVDESSPIGGIAVVGDRLYATDAEARIHAFVIEPGKTCRLTVDKSFGKDGMLVPPGIWVTAYLSNDKSGALYLAFFNQVVKIVEGVVQHNCEEVKGYTVADPNSDLVLAHTDAGNTPISKVVFGQEGCTMGHFEHDFYGFPDNVKRIGFAGDKVVVAGTMDDAGVRDAKFAILDAERKVQADFGDEFVSLGGFGPCGENLCVWNSINADILVVTMSGESKGSVNRKAVFGLEQAGIQDMVESKPGVHYFSLSQERSGVAGAMKIRDGFIVRVTGLQ